VNIMEELGLKRIGQRFSIDFQKRPAPTDEDVAAVVSERLTALLEAELRNTPPLKQVRLKRFLGLAKELAEADEAMALAMLLDERYQSSLLAPPSKPIGAEAKSPVQPPRRPERIEQPQSADQAGDETEKKRKRRRRPKRTTAGEQGPISGESSETPGDDS
jgi:ATP-dependent RNA helicase DeaD